MAHPSKRPKGQNKQEQSNQEIPDKEQPVKELSEKEKLEQLQRQNAECLFKIMSVNKKITKEFIETVQNELKGRKLSKEYRQKVNKWLRDANAQLDNKPKEEKRGKKAPEVGIKELRNDTKELIIKVQKYADQQIKQKKSVVRMLSAKRNLQRLLKHQFTE